MSSSASEFVGTIPELYDRCLGPVIFEPYAADLAARLTPPAKVDVLEVACGTGVLTRRLLERLPSASRLMATDLNQAMVDVAERRLGDDPRSSWRVADATALPFEDRAFDAVVCQFGVMFFPDPAAGMREARRVLRQGGRYLFNVWDDFAANPFGRIAHQTIASFFPSDPPGFYLTPFGFADESTIRSLLAAAGFGSIAIERVAKQVVSPTARDFAIGLVRGNPVLLMIAERGVADPERVIDAVEAALIREGGDRPFRSPTRALVATASV